MTTLLSNTSMDIEGEKIDVSDIEEIYVEYDGYVYVEG